MTTQTNREKYRDSRFPAKSPVRSDFASDEAYNEALLTFYKGQAELTEMYFHASASAVLTTFPDGIIAYANPVAQQLFGLTPDDFVRHRATEFLFDANGNSIGKKIAERISQGEMIRAEAVYVRRPSGQSELRMMTVQPVFVPGTDVLVRVIGSFSDPTPCERENGSLRTLNRELQDALSSRESEVTRLRAENDRLTILTLTDELTGVLNKAGFFRQARDRIERQRRERGSAGVLFLDPDGFKVINDTYGHDVGDQVLQLIASRGRDAIERHGGLFARFGGDEFFALLDGEFDDEAFKRIAGEIADAFPFDYEAEHLKTRKVETFRVDVSVGGSFRGGGAIPDFGILRKDADDAMYECKRLRKEGRERQPYVVRLGHLISSKPPKAT